MQEIMQGLYCFLSLACRSVPLQRLAMNRIDLAHFFVEGNPHSLLWLL